MEPFLISMVIAATPFLFAGMGELVAERSGVLNLGVEGMMLMGAVTAFAVANSSGSSVLGIVAGSVAGLAMALIFSVIALRLLANQAATGLALTIFGIGASGLIGQGFVGVALDPIPKLAVPFRDVGDGGTHQVPGVEQLPGHLRTPFYLLDADGMVLAQRTRCSIIPLCGRPVILQDLHGVNGVAL